MYKTLFHTIIFAYVYLIFGLVYPTEFSVTAPYQTTEISHLIEIEGIEQSSNLHSVSVLTMPRITPFQRMIYQLAPSMTVRKMSLLEQEITLSEQIIQGRISKVASYEQALIQSYTRASLIDENIMIDYDFEGMVVNYRVRKYNQLNIGDLIIEVNGIQNDYELMGNTFLSADFVELKVMRQQQVIDVSFQKDQINPWSFYPKYHIHQTTPNHSLPGLQIISGGPSGGLMQTLSLYLGLTNAFEVDSLVVGTGTIRYNGQVGSIGGLIQKIYTARHYGASYFIYPQQQASELDGYHFDDIELIGVSTFEEALEKLDEIFS